MALTINTHPDEVITNAPEFNVTTSLTEDGSHQNVRIRATVYIGGKSEAVAVLEQPKGLDDWDLFDLLKSFISRCNVALNGSAVHIGPDMGSELLTGWTDLVASFETFTTSGRELTSVIDTNASGGAAVSNGLGAGAVGDVFVMGLEEDYNDSGAGNFTMGFTDQTFSPNYGHSGYAGLTSSKCRASNIYFGLVRSAATTMYGLLNVPSGANSQLTGTVTIHKISDFRNNPGVYFSIKFEEVYENSSDVTTIGDDEVSDVMLFVPAVMRGYDDFANYLFNDGGGIRFLSRHSTPSTQLDALQNAPTYRHDMYMEVRVMYVSTGCYLKAQSVVDAGTNEMTDIPNGGWGMIVQNDAGLTYDPTIDDETIVFTLVHIESGGSSIDTMSAIVYCDQECHPSIKVGTTNYPLIKALSFVGDLGEEILLFRGSETERGRTDKEYYKDVNRISKVLWASAINYLRLRTKYETDGYRRLLHELLYTEMQVWMEDFYSHFKTNQYTEVTVMTDDVDITDKGELIESEIDIEYYE